MLKLFFVQQNRVLQELHMAWVMHQPWLTIQMTLGRAIPAWDLGSLVQQELETQGALPNQHTFYGSSQMYQDWWKSCKRQRLQGRLYPAKYRAVPRPQLFLCHARTNHLVRASPWLPREEQVLEMQGWGRGGHAIGAAGVPPSKRHGHEEEEGWADRAFGFLGKKGRISNASVSPGIWGVTTRLGLMLQEREGGQGEGGGRGRRKGEGNGAVSCSYAKKMKRNYKPPVFRI